MNKTMRSQSSVTRHSLLATLYSLFAILPTARALTDAWPVDVAQNTAVQRTYKQGESWDIRIDVRDGLRPLDLTGATARFFWHTNTAANVWWTNSAAVTGSIIKAAWTPEMDVGAASYPYWIGIWPQGSESPLWRVGGTIRLLPSPGFRPNQIRPPVQAIDFAAITVTNAPWLTAADLPGIGTGGAVESVNGQTGRVVITAQSINALTAELDEAALLALWKYAETNRVTRMRDSADETLYILGIAAYRFRMPSPALAGTPATAEASARLTANKLTRHGLRVVALMSDDPNPPEDWDALRGEAGAAFLHASRLPEPDVNTAKATNKIETLALTPGGAPCRAYLWVIVQLEEWSDLIAEYWVLGAGFLDAPALEIAFDRDVAPDPDDPAFLFPVEPKDLYDPARLYPLDALQTRNAWVNLPPALQAATGPASGILDAAFSAAIGIRNGKMNAVWVRTDGTVGVYTDLEAGQGLDLAPLAAVTGAAACSVSNTAAIVLRADGAVAAASYISYIPAYPGWELPPVARVGTGEGILWAVTADGALHMWSGTKTVAGTLTVTSASSGGRSLWVSTPEGRVMRLSGGAISSTPDTDHGIIGAVKVASGDNHAIALLADGTLRALNEYNEKGQLDIPPAVQGNARDIIAAADWTAAILRDGTVAAWGDDANGTVAALNGTVMESAGAVFNETAIFARVTAAGWREAEARIAAGATVTPPRSFDADITRELPIRRFVDAADTVDLSAEPIQDGRYGIRIDPAADASSWRMSMAVIGLRYQFRATSPAPNRVHFSVPAITAPGQGEIFSRIVFLRDTRAAPVNPLATIGNWRALWNGQTPAGYTQLAAESFVHREFSNSVFLPLAGAGHEGHVWAVVMPVHAPLAGDSLSWDIGQEGWEADRIFFWND